MREYTNKITKQRGKLFIGAVQEYTNSNGVALGVGFTAEGAYLLVSDNGDIFNAEKVARAIKSADRKADLSFPHCAEEYVELMTLTEEMMAGVKNYYAITDDIEADIKERIEELYNEFGQEEDYQLQ